MSVDKMSPEALKRQTTIRFLFMVTPCVGLLRYANNYNRVRRATYDVVHRRQKFFPITARILLCGSAVKKEGPARRRRPEFEVDGRTRAVNHALAHGRTTSTAQARPPVTPLTGNQKERAALRRP